MKNYVFDSFALLAFFGNEEGAEEVAEALTEISLGDAEGFLSVINLGEVFYMTVRKRGENKANIALQQIADLPITIVNVQSDEAIEAALLKANHKVSYADAFAVALAKRHKGILVTGDPELEVFSGRIKIKWINK